MKKAGQKKKYVFPHVGNVDVGNIRSNLYPTADPNINNHFYTDEKCRKCGGY